MNLACQLLSLFYICHTRSNFIILRVIKEKSQLTSSRIVWHTISKLITPKQCFNHFDQTIVKTRDHQLNPNTELIYLQNAYQPNWSNSNKIFLFQVISLTIFHPKFRLFYCTVIDIKTSFFIKF